MSPHQSSRANPGKNPVKKCSFWESCSNFAAFQFYALIFTGITYVMISFRLGHVLVRKTLPGVPHTP